MLNLSNYHYCGGGRSAKAVLLCLVRPAMPANELIISEYTIDCF